MQRSKVVLPQPEGPEQASDAAGFEPEIHTIDHGMLAVALNDAI